MDSATKKTDDAEIPDLLGDRPGLDFVFDVLDNHPNYKNFEADKTNYIAYIDEQLLNTNK